MKKEELAKEEELKLDRKRERIRNLEKLEKVKINKIKLNKKNRK